MLFFDLDSMPEDERQACLHPENECDAPWCGTSCQYSYADVLGGYFTAVMVASFALSSLLFAGLVWSVRSLYLSRVGSELQKLCLLHALAVSGLCLGRSSDPVGYKSTESRGVDIFLTDVSTALLWVLLGVIAAYNAALAHISSTHRLLSPRMRFTLVLGGIIVVGFMVATSILKILWDWDVASAIQFVCLISTLVVGTAMMNLYGWKVYAKSRKLLGGMLLGDQGVPVRTARQKLSRLVWMLCLIDLLVALTIPYQAYAIYAHLHRENRHLKPTPHQLMVDCIVPFLQLAACAAILAVFGVRRRATTVIVGSDGPSGASGGHRELPAGGRPPSPVSHMLDDSFTTLTMGTSQPPSVSSMLFPGNAPSSRALAGWTDSREHHPPGYRAWRDEEDGEGLLEDEDDAGSYVSYGPGGGSGSASRYAVVTGRSLSSMNAPTQ